MKTQTSYGRCECRGTLHERRVEVLRRRGRRRVLIQGVPAGVCDRCGLKVFAAKAVQRMEEILSGAHARGAVAHIPVRRFDQSA